MSEVRRLIEPNRRILIVDDNRSIHEDFEKILGGSAANDRGDLGALEAELFGGAAEESGEERFELDSAYQGEEALHKVKIARDASDGSVEVFFDDMRRPVMEAIDETFAWGQIGIGAFDDLGNFDNLVLRGKAVKGQPR